jgi:hypothetical protein
MKSVYFLSFEIINLLTFGLCLVHAWRSANRRAALAQLLAGVLFGLLLELATIRQLHAYRYGQLFLMVLDVPLAIGIAWGSMIYAARHFTDATNLPAWSRPLLDALLVLNIDLSIDAVAIRLGIWDWGQGLSFQYFGVPYANFWAWFWVVFSFSAGLRWLLAKTSRSNSALLDLLPPLGAILTGLGGVLLTNALIAFWIPRAFYEVTIGVVLLGALLLVLAQRPRMLRPADPLMGRVSLVMHGYFLMVGVVSGALFSPWPLLVVSLLMAAIAFFVYERGAGLARMVGSK